MGHLTRLVRRYKCLLQECGSQTLYSFASLSRKKALVPLALATRCIMGNGARGGGISMRFAFDLSTRTD